MNPALAVFVIGIPAAGVTITTLIVPVMIEDPLKTSAVQAAYSTIGRLVLSSLAGRGGPADWYTHMRSSDLENFVTGGGMVIDVRGGSLLATVPGNNRVLQRQGDAAALRQLDHMMTQAKAELARRRK